MQIPFWLFLNNRNRKGKRRPAVKVIALAAALVCSLGCTGCSSINAAGCERGPTDENEDGDAVAWSTSDGYISASDEIKDEVMEEVSNSEFSLSVPTYVTKIDGMWFIVDCYHNQIIYNDNMTDPVYEWKVLTKNTSQPHTMASDGEVILVDDTENNRVLVFEKKDDLYVNTQSFNDIGKRPHYTVYDEADRAFYVWSSTTGEMYIFRREENSSRVYLTEIRKAGGEDVSLLDGTYIRSFYMLDDEIYFVSGIGADGRPSGILICDKDTLEIKEKIEVPDSMAGMVALVKEGDYFYITISTDIAGDQNAATIIRTKDLHGLLRGEFEDIYSDYFVGGGTPYNITKIDDTFFLTEHRVPGHSIWSFRIENDEVIDVNALY